MLIRWKKEPEQEAEKIIHTKREELPIKPWWSQDDTGETAEVLTAMEVKNKPDKSQRAILRQMRAKVRKNERQQEKKVKNFQTADAEGTKRSLSISSIKMPQIKISKVKILQPEEEKVKKTRVKEIKQKAPWLKGLKKKAPQVKAAEHEKSEGRTCKALENGLFGVAAILLVVGLVTYVPATISVTANPKEKNLPITAVDTKENKVSLTFDATGKNDDIEGILELLEKHDVKASFFISGDWFDKYPESAALIAEKGHDLGSLGQSNTSMNRLAVKQIDEELFLLHKKVSETIGLEMKLFRPPYGDYNDDVMKAANSAGYLPVMWNIDSLDWKDYGIESLVETVVKHKDLKGGSIVLLHADAKYTCQALESIILGLKEGGYELVSVSELLISGGYDFEKQIKN